MPAPGPGGPARPLAETLSTSQRIVITVAVMMATVMEVLDTSIVNVALPQMQGNLGATLDEIAWVATGYIIANVIILPLTGWLSDRFGRRRYLTYSVILFTVASLGCGVSRNLWLLVGFRVLQGAGGAAFLSTAQATLTEIFPAHLQGVAQATFGIGVIMAPTLGPTLGGFLTDRYSWPWIFFINVPIGVIATVLTFRFVPDSPAARPAGPFDFVGIGLLALGLGPMQEVLERGQRKGWFEDDVIVALTALSAIGLAAFLVQELRRGNRHPAVDLRVLADRNLAAGTIYGFALGLELYAAVFLLPQFLQTVQPHSAEQTGLLLLPGGLASAFMMPLIGQTARRVDLRLLIAAGMALLALSMMEFADRLQRALPNEQMTWPLIFRGAGLGLQFVPLSILALGTVPVDRLAQASGLYNLARQLGGSFGIALFTTLLDRRMHHHYARLAEHVARGAPRTDAALAMLRRTMASTPGAKTALAALTADVRAEAAALAFADCFRVLGWVSFGALVLVALFTRPRRLEMAAGAH